MKLIKFPGIPFYRISGFIFLLLFNTTVVKAAITGDFKSDRLARFINWSVKDGLGADKVLDILEDRSGIIWLATTDGLSKFDGIRFTVYRQSGLDSNSLSDNKITCITEDPDGNLWIGTFNGLNKLDRTSGRFVRHYAHKNGLPENHVKAVYADKDGFLWIHTADGTLSKYDYKKDRWEYSSHRSAYFEGEYYYHHIFESADGTLWIGGRGMGVCRLAGKNIETTRSSIVNPAVEYFEGSCFAGTRDGEVFAGDDKGNFSRYNPEKDIFETILKIPVSATCAVTDAGDCIWVGGRDGLSRLDMKGGNHQLFFYDSQNESSLASNNVYCLLKDSRNNIWIGTDRGVSMYSRSLNSIRAFRMLRSSGEGLSSNVITALMQDRDGLLWVGTEENGVDTIHLKTGKIGNLKYDLLKGNLSPEVAARENYTLMQYRRHGIPIPNSRINENKVNALYQDREGKIYIGLWSHVGFNVYDKKKKECKRYCLWSIPAGYLFPLLFEGNLFGANWYAGFLEDSRSNFWCATWEGVGLNLFDREKGAFSGKHFIPGDIPRPPRGCIYSFIRDTSAHRIYMAGDQYYGYYDLLARTFHRYAEIFPPGYPNRDIINEYYRYCGAELLEIPVNTAGLRLLSRSGHCLLLASDNSLIKHNTATGNIEVLYKPSEFCPDIAVAYSYDGMSVYVAWNHDVVQVGTDGSFIKHLTAFIKNFDILPLKNKISALYETNGRDLVFITDAGEYVLPHHSDRLIKKDWFNIPFNKNVYTIQNGAGGNIYIGTTSGLYKSSLQNPSDLVMLLDSASVSYLYREQGILYACTSNGLYLLDECTGERKKHFSYHPAERYSLPSNLVYSVTRIDDSLLFVSTGNGLTRLNERSMRFADVSGEADNTLSSRLASCIMEDSQGFLWYGTTENGVNKIDLTSGKIKRFSYHLWDTTGIAGNNIGDVFEDSRNIIWVGTDKGLCRYHPDYTFDKVNELGDREIRRILEDEAGCLWISTDYGLYCYHPVTGKVRVFYSYNGFLNDTYSGAACRLNDGRMAFGGGAGFDIFDPATVNAWDPATIVFTNFKIGDDLLYADMPERVDLKYENNSFSVDFSATDYVFGSALRYRYRLQGFDKNWVYTVPGMSHAKYTNLSGGRYTLEVESTNAFGEWSGNTQCRLIIIGAPFYQQGWFILLVLFLAICGIYLYILVREKRLREKNRQLVCLVEQRTSEIKKEIDSKNRFFSIISHDLKNPLNALGLVSGSLYDNYNKMTEEERLGMLDTIRSSSRSTAQLLDSLLLWVLSQMDMIHPDYVPVDLYAVTKSVADLFALQVQEKEIILENRMDPAQIACTDENMYSTILRNLLGNAVKYSRKGGSIQISSEKSAGKIYISVRDNGIGMSETVQEKLFRIDKKITTRGTGEEEGTGIGLIITSEFVRKLGEEISVTSREGAGSVFVFSVKAYSNPINE